MSYDETGKPITGAFNPVDFKFEPEELEKLLIVPAKSVDDVLTHAQTVLSAWLLETEKIETADRETSRIETNPIHCETWPNGTPKLCEIAFYFVTTEERPRVLTGVR